MNIAAIGSIKRLEALQRVLSSVALEFTGFESTKNIDLSNFNLIFDLNFDDHLDLSPYMNLTQNPILCLNTIKVQLEAFVPPSLVNNVVGINALPTFLERKSIECSTLSSQLDLDFFKKLGWEQIHLVKSRVGMVSPRVIFMIINEAYFTLEEGTANREDIDKGMKLGTAYPFGPFEWSQLVGIDVVYETLLAIKTDTGDERYKICNLLKTDYLLFKSNELQA